MGTDDIERSNEQTASTDDVLAVLRRPASNPHLLRGFGPLALAIALLVLMALLVPSIAAERIVQRPASGPDDTGLEHEDSGP